MTTVAYLIASILPTLLLVGYLGWHRNRFEIHECGLVKPLCCGVASALVALIAELAFGWLSNISIVLQYMVVVPIAEEAAKLLFVCLLLRTMSHGASSRYETIRLSALVALGFATIENVCFIMSDPNVALVIVRALFSVPGHFACGVLMGYFIAHSRREAQMGRGTRESALLYLAFALPVLLHGLFDYGLKTMTYGILVVEAVKIIVALVLVRKMGAKQDRAPLSMQGGPVVAAPVA